MLYVKILLKIIFVIFFLLFILFVGKGFIDIVIDTLISDNWLRAIIGILVIMFLIYASKFNDREFVEEFKSKYINGTAIVIFFGLIFLLIFIILRDNISGEYSSFSSKGYNVYTNLEIFNSPIKKSTDINRIIMYYKKGTPYYIEWHDGNNVAKFDIIKSAKNIHITMDEKAQKVSFIYLDYHIVIEKVSEMNYHKEVDIIISQLENNKYNKDSESLLSDLINTRMNEDTNYPYIYYNSKMEREIYILKTN